MCMLVRCRTLLTVALVTAACSPDAVAPAPAAGSHSLAVATSSYRYSYLVTATSASGLPSALAADAYAAGGTVVATMPQIGLAVIESDSPDFADAARLDGIESIVPDIPMASIDDGSATPSAEAMRERQ